jgi:F0F1-type ATP synthase membrane subunit b/b'
MSDTGFWSLFGFTMFLGLTSWLVASAILDRLDKR